MKYYFNIRFLGNTLYPVPTSPSAGRGAGRTFSFASFFAIQFNGCYTHSRNRAYTIFLMNLVIVYILLFVITVRLMIVAYILTVPPKGELVLAGTCQPCGQLIALLTLDGTHGQCSLIA